jgi:hypothetical protein
MDSNGMNQSRGVGNVDQRKMIRPKFWNFLLCSSFKPLLMLSKVYLFLEDKYDSFNWIDRTNLSEKAIEYDKISG